MPKATAVFDADDSRLATTLTRINQRMLALQERVAKFAAAWMAVQSVSHLVAARFEHLRGAFEVGDKLSNLSAESHGRSFSQIGRLLGRKNELRHPGLTGEPWPGHVQNLGAIFRMKAARPRPFRDAGAAFHVCGRNLPSLSIRLRAWP